MAENKRKPSAKSAKDKPSPGPKDKKSGSPKSAATPRVAGVREQPADQARGKVPDSSTNTNTDDNPKTHLLKYLADYSRIAKSGANGQAHANSIIGLRKELHGLDDDAVRAAARKLVQKVERASQLPRPDERTAQTLLAIQTLVNFVEEEL